MPDPPLIGAEVPGHELRAIVGSGGSATVYEAFDTVVQRRVAIKVLHRQVHNDRDKALFDREVVALGRVSTHPNAISVFGSGVTSAGQPFVVMEFATNGTFAGRLRSEGQLDVATLLEVGIQVGCVVATAHGRGVIHGDLKPSNVLIGDFGQPLLGDFGVASVADLDLTAPSSPGHTVQFAAPDILNGGSLTEASDVYSLGATLFAFANGHAPHAASTAAQTIRNIVDAAEAPDPGPELPECVRTCIRAAMAPRAGERTATARDLVEELQRCQRHLSLESTPLTIQSDGDVEIDLTGGPLGADLPTLHPEPSPGPLPARKRPKRRFVAAGLALLLAATGAGAAVLRDPAAESASTVETGNNGEPTATEELAISPPEPMTTVDCPPDLGERPPLTNPRSRIGELIDTTGRLAVVGTAAADDGVGFVDAVLVTTDQQPEYLYWNGDQMVWQERFRVFQLPVIATSETEASWSFDQALPAGTYRFRTWARSVSGGGEDGDTQVMFTITDPIEPDPEVDAIAVLLANPVLDEDEPLETAAVRVDTPTNGGLVTPSFRFSASNRNPAPGDELRVSVQSHLTAEWWNFATAEWQPEAVAGSTPTAACAMLITAAPGDYTATATVANEDGIVTSRSNEFTVKPG